MLFGWDNIHSFAFFPLNSTGLIGCVALHDQFNILGLPLPVYSVTENSILYLVYHLISHLYTCLAGAMYLFPIFICCWWCDDGYRGQALKHESTPNLPPSITISIFTVASSSLSYPYIWYVQIKLLNILAIIVIKINNNYKSTLLCALHKVMCVLLLLLGNPLI